MKFLTKKSVTHKIILALVIVVLMNFSIPPIAFANSNIGLDLLTEFAHLVASLGDVVMGLLNKTMLGTEAMWGSVMLEKGDINLQNNRSYLYVSKEDLEDKNATIKKVDSKKLNGLIWEEWKIPNTLYCPENIFANKIAALDVNFIHPNSYTSVEYDKSGENPTDDSIKSQKSAASKLNTVISSWYKAFRNISIVGLLSVLVYLGIRLLISTAATEKAKYKETIKDWIVALCLVFIIHIIMSGILMMTEKIIDLFGSTAENGIIVQVVNENGEEVGTNFRTNLTGYVRFLAQASEIGDAMGYTAIYIALVIFTVMFTITYLKRFLWMAFLTMIAPLVSLTYPIDKAGDGQAQAFNMWVKEYFMHAILQPVHLLLFTVLVSSAYDLATDNILYACVAIGFLIPAEKFIKKMFKLDKAETTSGLGAVAGGALAMKGINAVTNKVKGRVAGGAGAGGDKIKTADDRATLDGGKRKKTVTPKDSSEMLGLEADSNAPDADDSQQDENNDRYRNLNEDERRRVQELEEKEKEDYESGDYNSLYLNQDRIAEQQELEVLRKKADERNAEEQRQQEEERQLAEQRAQEEAQRKAVEDAKIGNRFKRVGTALSDNASLKKARMLNRLENAFSPEGLKRGAIKGAKTLGRIGGAAAGATLVGTAAAGAALTTGDLSTGTGIVAGGVLAGGGVGASLGGKSIGTAIEAGTGFASTMSDAWKTDAERAQAKADKNARFDKNFKLDEKNISYLRKQHITNPAEWLQDDKTQAFLDAGITDINTIFNARDLMEKSNGRINLEGAVTRAKAASELSDNFASSNTQKNALREDLRRKSPSKVSNDQIDKYILDLIDIKKVN